MRSALCAAASLVLVAGCQSATDHSAALLQPAGTDSAPLRIEADVRFLADDLLEGREAGTRGYALAAHYVATRFAASGLQPAGDDGSWLQQVALLKGERIKDGAMLAIERGEQRIEFVFEQDFLPAVDFNRESSSLSAPLVFVGQGVHAPELDHDDFDGIDVSGKVAVVLSGAPERFANAERAHYSSGRIKAEALAERGAVGMLMLSDPVRAEKYPWARGAANWARPSMRLRDANSEPLDTQPTLIVSASLSLEASRTLLEGAPMPADEIYRRLEAGELESFELPWTVDFASRSRHTAVESSNVIGRVPGSDAGVADQSLVYTAHLDHVGIGAEVDGDGIYNGALDNALGVAIVIEAARAAAAAPGRRPQLFVALTAEEKGLLGAEHFAQSPLSDGSRIIANINIDMPILLTELRDALPIGREHSSLGADVEAIASDLDIPLSADTMPEEVVFVRSDQYAFIRRGIPALYLEGGSQAVDPAIDAVAVMGDFLRRHYHQPSDDVSLPIHYPSAARLAELAQRVGQRVADAEQPPAWNSGDFFERTFGDQAASGTTQ